MQQGPSSKKSSEGSAEQPSPTSPWSQEERISVVTKLHNLELINKRLTEEKSHLQRQLNHVLRRLASERFVRHSGDLEDVSKLLRELVQPSTFERPSSSTEQAPLASAESVSMMESNGRVSITEYSSLSDTFEEIVLEKDLVRKISLELSSTEEGKSEVEIAGEEFVTPTPTTAPPYHSPSISEVSEDHVDWEFHIPPPSPALSYSAESTVSSEAIPPLHESQKVGAHSTPHTPVLIHRPQFSLSLPPSPYKYISRQAIIRGIEEARRSAFKWLETAVQEPVEMERKPIFRTPPSPRRTESIAERAKRKAFMPLPLRRALKKSSHKPRVKVGSSDDFLNDFFSSSEVVQEEGLHAAIIFSRYTEVARELDGLFSHLHAYTCIRRHCFVIQSIPAQELQRNISYFYQTRQNNFDRLCRDETSSEEARSTAGIPLSTLTPEITQLPIPSASQYRSSSASTEYNVPPTDDSTNNVELELSESHKKSFHYAGRLSKLSSRFKLWQTFWCILADKSLLFYSDESEVDKWPKKCIDLSGVQRVERRREPRTDGRGKPVTSSAFNLIMENGRIYTLRSIKAIENRFWENKIRHALRRVQAERIVQMHEAQLVTSGWLRRYRRGQSQRVWGMLMGTFLVYSRDSRGQILTGYRDLSTTYIRCPAVFEEVTAETDTDVASSHLAYDNCDIADSESDIGFDKTEVSNLTIALWTSNRDPVYLVCSNNNEYERWKHHLLRACWFSSLISDTTPSVQPEARFLHLWGQLVRPCYSLHRTHSESVLKEPICRVLDSSLEANAIRLSEKLLSLSNLHARKTLEESEQRPSTSYRLPVDASKYNLIKEIAQMCFENSGLKDELFLQLIKQATPSAYILPAEVQHFGTEPTRRRAARVVDLLCHRDGAEDRRAHSSHRQQQSQSSRRFVSPPGYSYKWIPIIVMWECLAIYSTVFLPSPPVLACLQAYLTQFVIRVETGREEQTSPRGRRRKVLEARRLYSEISHFAAFCTDMIVRCRIRGGRTIVPSCFEVVAISLRNPYTHSLPFSLPIHFSLPIGYEVISFDGTMKVAQLMGSLLSKLELSEAVAQGLCHCGLYCRISGPQYAFGRAPGRPKLIYLENGWNICDIISLYESKLTRADQSSELNLEDMTIDLVFRITAVSKKAVVQASPFTDRIMDIVAHQLHSDLYSGEFSIMLRGTHFLELTALMCRCDYVDYAELQRRQEVTLTQIMDRYFPRHCLATWGGDDDQALIELKLLLLERWNKVCRETSDPETNAETNEFRLPKPAFAYTMYFWRLHPAGACIRQFPCNLVNISEVPPDETIWITPSFDKICLLRICTFDNVLAHPIYPNGIEGGVSGMACFKHIPLNRIISYGVQQTGAFFIVFSKVSETRHLRNKRERARYYSGQGGSTTSTMSSITVALPKSRQKSTAIRDKAPLTELDDQLDKLLFFIRDLCEINELCNVLNFTLENFL